MPQAADIKSKRIVSVSRVQVQTTLWTTATLSSLKSSIEGEEFKFKNTVGYTINYSQIILLSYHEVIIIHQLIPAQSTIQFRSTF